MCIYVQLGNLRETDASWTNQSKPFTVSLVYLIFSVVHQEVSGCLISGSDHFNLGRLLAGLMFQMVSFLLFFFFLLFFLYISFFPPPPPSREFSNYSGKLSTFASDYNAVNSGWLTTSFQFDEFLIFAR